MGCVRLERIRYDYDLKTAIGKKNDIANRPLPYPCHLQCLSDKNSRTPTRFSIDRPVIITPMSRHSASPTPSQPVPIGWNIPSRGWASISNHTSGQPQQLWAVPTTCTHPASHITGLMPSLISEREQHFAACDRGPGFSIGPHAGTLDSVKISTFSVDSGSFSKGKNWYFQSRSKVFIHQHGTV